MQFQKILKRILRIVYFLCLQCHDGIDVTFLHILFHNLKKQYTFKADAFLDYLIYFIRHESQSLTPRLLQCYLKNISLVQAQLFKQLLSHITRARSIRNVRLIYFLHAIPYFKKQASLLVISYTRNQLYGFCPNPPGNVPPLYLFLSQSNTAVFRC